MILAKLRWALSNRVVAVPVSGNELAFAYFLEGDWVRVRGELRCVWKRDTARDVLWLY